MTILLADVGGTNTRIALVEACGNGETAPIDASFSYGNSAYPGMAELLAEHLARHSSGAVHAACLAVAGPVQGDFAQLTNRDWRIDASVVGAQLGGAPVVLLNDLAALGHAVAASDAGTRLLGGPDRGARINGQALVVGIGTGFNVACLYRRPDGDTTLLSAEAGHAYLPAPVKEQLGSGIGADLVESCFSGSGLARLHAHLHGAARQGDAGQIGRDAAQGHPEARQTMDRFARLLGLLGHSLLMQYMPLDGLYLAGSVARGMVDAGAGEAFVDSLRAVPQYADQLGQVPVRLIEDDAAALRGCLRLLRQQGLTR